MAPLEEDDAEQEEELEEITLEDEEDVEPLRTAKGPKLPPAADVELHDRDRLPFRDWCKWCNLGRGRGTPHRHARGSMVPLVGVDCFYITSAGVKKRNELEYDESEEGEVQLKEARDKGEIIKCLVIRCFETKNIWSHCVPVKGADEEDYAAGLVSTAVLWLGHLEVILKGDNEPALQALVERTLTMLRVKVQEEDPNVNLKKLSKEVPPKYDSQSNGGTEVGVRLVRSLFRTLELCLEGQIGKFIPVQHPVVPWLLEHTAFLLNVKTRGSDGLTPWARVKGCMFG